MSALADPPWKTFRKIVVGALWRLDRDRFFYVHPNTLAARCPVCRDGHVHVEFLGETPRADIRCSLGCPEVVIARALRLPER